MPTLNRRNFLKASGLATIPAILPVLPGFANGGDPGHLPPDKPVVKFFGDGEIFDGAAYWEQLQQAHNKQPLIPDRYGMGGAVEELEKKFAAITGKEKAVYMPTGTMANQLAIAVLSGENTKVFVQDTSHVFRDEADAAQSVFHKRLMPLARDETYFTAGILKNAIDNLAGEEVFKSGIGAVSVENPVRRSEGRIVPVEEIKKISEYCRANGIKLHLDGARLFLASAWSGIPVAKYSSYFDTVYISLYKYLGASAGAMLCGDENVIDKMPHLIKVHGGNQFGNWLNAAMALHRLQGLEERLSAAIQRSEEIFSAVNQLPGVKIDTLEGGTNIYFLNLPTSVSPIKFTEILANKYFIRVPRPDKQMKSRLFVNETLLYRDAGYIINAFTDAIKQAGT